MLTKGVKENHRELKLLQT